MLKPFKLITLFIALQFSSFAAIASDNTAKPQQAIFVHFSTCATVMDGVPVTLDFFEEVKLNDNNDSTGIGYVIQTIGDPAGDNMKLMGKLDVVNEPGNKAKAINMYAMLDPSSLFASFKIELSKKSDLEIFAKQFGAVWGKFSCKSSTIP